MFQKSPVNHPKIGILAILLVFILFLFGIAWVRLYEGKYLIQTRLQSRWEQTIRETLFAHQQYIQNAPHSLPEHVLHLEFDSLFQLKSWSTNQIVLDIAQLQKQWQHPESALLQMPQGTFWHLKLKHENHYHSYLVTLVQTYSIDNEFFIPYAFGQEDFPKIIKFDKVLLYEDSDYPVVKLSASAKISYAVHSFEPLAEPYWLLATGLIIVFGIIFLFKLFSRLSLRLGGFILELGLTFGLVMLRLLMLWLQIPHSFSAIKLFSPEVLAISTINPSLGDVLLNFSVLTVLAFRWWRFLETKKLVPNETLSILAGFATTIVSGSLSSFFFYLFYTARVNSKIYYEVSDIFRLDVYSVLLFAATLLILSSFYLITLIGVRLWLLLAPGRSLTRAIQEGVVFTIGLSLLLFVFFSFSQWAIVFAAVLFLVLAFLVGILQEFTAKNPRIPLVIIVIAGFAWITNVAISESYQQQSQSQLSRYANRFANPRDVIIEFEFDNLVAEIQKDTVLFQSTAKSTNIIASEFTQKLLNIHLSTGIRGYDIHVFLFDQNGLRIDNQFMELPTIPYDFKKTIGKPTLSKQLFQINTPNSLSDYAYLGRFKVPLEPWNDVWVQLELQPKIGKTDRLYPQLLLDNNLRQRLNLPEGFSLASYRNQQLVESIGEYDFSAVYTPSPKAAHGHWEDSNSNFFQTESNTERIIQLHSPKRSVFQIITAFSFLVYFYLTIVCVVVLLVTVRRWKKQMFFFQPSFAQRIQLILAGMTFVPLLIMGILSTPQFKSFYLQTIRFRLKQDLSQCANLLQQQPYLLSELSRLATPNPTATDALTRFGQVLAADLNLFRIDGKLFASTRPRIFQAGLISDNINPFALNELTSRKIRSVIIEENIGKLTYLSGYHAIIDNQYKVIAYLNLPYLSQQNILENQLRQFLAYLINLYVVTLLVVVVGGYFIGRSVIYPLQLLKQRMEGITLGEKNHTIEWKSSDEIGAIILSYNEMLAKLSENEKKLAKNEREMAWREMARQVAHEIKNPLTPMKLGLQHLEKILAQGNNYPQQISKLVASLLTQIDSLAYIANSFSQFAVMPSVQKTNLDLVQLLNSVQQLYANSPEGRVTFESNAATVIVWADKDQLMRVFSNLVKNALQAMIDYGQVKIILETHEYSAQIQVIDNGSGIPEEIQTKIFEPNFSTKNSGMGLGLAISQKIIEQSGGTISFRSSPREGTIFTVILPILGY